MGRPSTAVLVASISVRDEEIEFDGHEDDAPLKRRDLVLMDMDDGGVVKVLEGLGGFGTLCTSADGLVCVTGGSTVGAHVVDPSAAAAAAMLMSCSNVEVRAHGEYPFVVTPFFPTFGFGRAAVSGAHKVLRLSDDHQTCELFTLPSMEKEEDVDKQKQSTGQWRQTEPPPAPVPHDRGAPVAINGILYFLAEKDKSSDSLLRFDLDTELWKKNPPLFQGPRELVSDEHWKTTSSVRITELNGALCVVQSELWKTYTPQRTSIWILAGFDDAEAGGGGIWSKAYTIPMAPTAYLYMPLRVRDDGRLLLHCTLTAGSYFDSQRKLVLQVFDPCTRTCTDVLELPKNLTRNIRTCSFIG